MFHFVSSRLCNADAGSETHNRIGPPVAAAVTLAAPASGAGTRGARGRETFGVYLASAPLGVCHVDPLRPVRGIGLPLRKPSCTVNSGCKRNCTERVAREGGEGVKWLRSKRLHNQSHHGTMRIYV